MGFVLAGGGFVIIRQNGDLVTELDFILLQIGMDLFLDRITDLVIKKIQCLASFFGNA